MRTLGRFGSNLPVFATGENGLAAKLHLSAAIENGFELCEALPVTAECRLCFRSFRLPGGKRRLAETDFYPTEFCPATA